MLENDYDPGSKDELTITEINGEAFVSGETVDLPSNAKLTVYSEGSLEYDPNRQFEF